MPEATQGTDTFAALSDLLQQRHSCRAFLPEPVPRAIIEQALQLAQRTGSWCNSQAWQVCIASGAATTRLRQRLLELAAKSVDASSDFPFPAEYRGAYRKRRFECAIQLYRAVGIERGDRAGSARQAMENFRLFGAPHVAVITSDAALGTYGAVDVGGYVQILMLALQSQGVASIAQAALAMFSADVKEELGIAPDRLMVCGVSFGYEDSAHPANAFRTARAALPEVVDWVDG